jgi:hypothetical protein
MKRIFFLICLAVITGSCDQGNKKATLKDSTGKLNSVLVIIDNQLWSGEVGDSLRNKLASPVDGLPQQEPLLSINQTNPKAFDGFVTTARNIVVVKKDKSAYFEIKKDIYAQPQQVIYISGQTITEIIDVLEKNNSAIIETIKAFEIAENQRRITKSLLDDSKIKKKFNISINMASAYKLIIEDDRFMWIRKELPSGNNSLLIYAVPLDFIDPKSNTVEAITVIRDSIGQKYIQGTLPDTYMITEASYAPYQFDIKINGLKTIETKGTWELKNDYMAGPFINYAIRDEKNNRYLILEGFCYNPSSAKRDLMFELEAIIKSVKFL